MRGRWLLVPLAALALGGSRAATPAEAPGWVRTWAAAPSETVGSGAGANPTDALSDVTIRMPVRLSAGGSRLRLRLSNELGAEPLTLGAVHVALADENGAPVAGSDRAVTFAGQASPVIPAHSPLNSDAVALAVPERARLIVSIHVPGAVAGLTQHAAGYATARFARGDRTGGGAFDVAGTSRKRYVLSAVDVAGGRAAGTIVAFGDSITDGAASTVDGDARWPDVLAERMAAAGRLRFGIANAGIGGNRLLLTGAGPAALARLDRDVLAVPGVRYLVVLEGVNDIGTAARQKRPLPSAETLIAAYSQIVARAHDRGVKVIGATILPFKGAGYWTAEGEAVRGRVNAWIRAPGSFDGVIDFDRATRDGGDPLTMAAPFDSGDHLHPRDAGYRAMAGAVDLRLFR